MIEVRNLSLHVGVKEILENVSVRISDNDRIGLVGFNGVGKSTFLKFLSCKHQKDLLIESTGEVIRSNSVSIGYLPQELSISEGLELSAVEFVMNEQLRKISHDMKDIEKQMEKMHQENDLETHNSILNKYGELSELFEAGGGYQMQAQAEKTLDGLGFKKTDFIKQVKKFSGGWQMRLLIAKLLIQKPSMLFLDEPTNHLDIDALAWLEEFLRNYDGCVVVISHDRFFLDKVTRRTLEISMRTITDYKGNYSFYEKEKILRYEISLANYEQKQKEIKHLQKFVERFRYKATKARQAQSRLKTIEKMKMGLESPEKNTSKISFAFPTAQRSGKIVMTLNDVSKSYILPDQEKLDVLKKVSLEIARGDVIAVVGPNGAGKSTLCSILSGEIEFEGERKEGHQVIINFYTQHQADFLNGENTVLEEILTASNDISIQQKARNILGMFLFSGDDAKKRVKVLSGGEKSRLSMAKLLMQSANFLILDEPTNHLDMQSKEVLIEALQKYKGTVLIVSHDRYFLDSLATKVWEVKNRRVKEFFYSYSEYMEKSMMSQLAQEKSQSKPSPKAKRKKTQFPEDQKIHSSKKEDVKKIEEQIFNIEDEIKQIEERMLDPSFFSNKENSAETQKNYKELKQKAKNLYAQWEEDF